MNKIVSRRKLLAAGVIAAAVTTAAYAADEQTIAQPTVTSRTIAVEHIRIASSRPFAEVRQRLESAVPQLDPSIFETLARGDQARAQGYHDNGPKLSIFLSRDHGARLEIAGAKKNAVQYEIGNPLTATKMTRYQLPAALYAPLRVVLFEDEQGHGIFEYDKPSSLFGQFGDERVTDVGRYLDATLEATLRHAAE
jgi:23S rRNA G2445 N2-methylase RlmL